MSTRRESLARLRPQPGVNAGLWLDKYIEDARRQQRGSEEQGTAQARLVEEVAGQRVPGAYAGFFERWRTALAAHGAQTQRATVLGRMIVGLGAESVLETAVTLQRTYGVPMIPGSALKGLAAACARQVFGPDWAADAPAYTTLFGSTDSAGYVTFFDALYIPGSAEGDRPLAPDVLTVHHQAYYNQGGSAPPADWDSPVPVPFISASGAYLIALGGPPAWVERALQLLAWGGMYRGVGAKTSSGYGRLVVAGVVPPGIGAADKPKADSAHLSETTGTTPAPTTPPASTRSVPGVGAVFAGKVIERGDSLIAISVPGHPPESVLATLTVADDTPGWRPGDLARVEVVSAEDRGGRTILTVRRAPKAKKS
ncbi:type III-B CRISPR module RAMP protein Cmr6 [Oscillochloris sp. ZM17-4]|uniref:type III-B CRISPR module RAMP protein Cmr6 n=1 Tax=Oscillochloris sp. ZM17-4 TaxID=2866714 RepID=UPI001C72ECCC|nr:type III-B CRISPR module RAMP protein Cmr6 [Oscillochloris sp. ZM17-4]MBX0331289.1 type III-B CRISPR module RAMP protein Cmr6 [Oscillochloris sp. ZM17-4]